MSDEVVISCDELHEMFQREVQRRWNEPIVWRFYAACHRGDADQVYPHSEDLISLWHLLPT